MAEPAAEVLDVRALRVRESSLQEQENVPQPKPLIGREETFTVRYPTPDGAVREATLTSRIMGHDERILASRMASRLAGGPWENLPLGAQLRIYQLAVVSIQLRDPPAWVEEWMQVDDRLLAGIAGQLNDHEHRYFRRDNGEGAEGAGIAELVIVPVGAAKAGSKRS